PPSPLLESSVQESEYELAGSDGLPDEPIALIVLEGLPDPKWTVSIPHNASFPLEGKQYRDICEQGDDLKTRLEESSISRRHWRPHKSGYYANDPNFLDVADAEMLGVLPKSSPITGLEVCKRSLTFAMETEDASFGKTLLMLWMSYGLAKKEGRAFFVDDTRWPYGKYTSYFAPPPPQACAPPPPHQMLPCPHEARHLLVSAATAPWTFGLSFEEKFTKPRRHGSEKNRVVYDMISTGYKALFQIIGEDASYARNRTSSLRMDASSHNGAIVGMQIRRGDLHPFEYQFSRDYLPLERYATAARSLSSRLQPKTDHYTATSHIPLLLASDDPNIITSPDVTQPLTPLPLQKAQSRITLATKAALDLASPVKLVRLPGSGYIKYIPENSGWEGGFYSRLFFSIGQPAGSHAESGEEVSEQAMRLRELVGRAYLLDLAVLGEADGVVCAVSSATCRVLGVMVGWEGVVGGSWVNVDDGRGWSWDG
ncbi:hypothetical protein EJ03DRAFT_247692, partial [Teratosphaeria nubilosa]